MGQVEIHIQKQLQAHLLFSKQAHLAVLEGSNPLMQKHPPPPI